MGSNDLNPNLIRITECWGYISSYPTQVSLQMICHPNREAVNI